MFFFFCFLLLLLVCFLLFFFAFPSLFRSSAFFTPFLSLSFSRPFSMAKTKVGKRANKNYLSLVSRCTRANPSSVHLGGGETTPGRIGVRHNGETLRQCSFERVPEPGEFTQRETHPMWRTDRKNRPNERPEPLARTTG